MKVKEVVDLFQLEVLNSGELDKEISGGYSCDLLSNVMARASAGNLWLTVQGHQNAIAVALLLDLAAVIIVENQEIEREAITKAREKGVTLLRTDLSAYQLTGKLKEIGI